MRICSITPRYTPQITKSFGSNPYRGDEFGSNQIKPPYLPEKSADLLKNFYNTVYQDSNWLKDEPVEYNGITFSLIDGPFSHVPKAIKASYPDGKEVAVCKYYDGKYGDTIMYAIKESKDSEYVRGGLTGFPNKITVCHQSYTGSSFCPSLSENSVKLASDYLSKFYSDAIEAYNQ